MGPVGTLLKPYGPLEAEDVKATFAEQAKALAEGGVDLLLIETMFSFEETTAAFEGAKSVTDLPIVVSFSYDRGTRTMMGVKPKDVMKRYTEMGATLVGANCGTTLAEYGSRGQRICGDCAKLPAVGEAECRCPAHGYRDRARRVRHGS